MRVAIASEAWNNPKTLVVTIYTSSMMEAARSAGVDAYPLPLVSHYGARVGGLIGPLAQQVFGTYGVADLVHQTSLAVRRGVGIATVHDLYPFQGRRLADRFFVWQTAAALRRAKRVVVTTDWMRAEVARVFPKHRGKLRVVPIPHVTPPLDRLGHSEFDALWIGRLAPNKDPALYLRLAAAFPELRFALRGSSSPGRQALEREVESMRRRLPNVVAIPTLSEERKDELYRSVPVLVSTSTYEGFHVPAMEAYVRGTKLALPFIQPYIELYGSEAPNVFWYPPRDLSALISVFRGALAAPWAPPSPTVISKVSYATVGAQLRAIYEELT